jgi:hypothetical protein
MHVHLHTIPSLFQPLTLLFLKAIFVGFPYTGEYFLPIADCNVLHVQHNSSVAKVSNWELRCGWAATTSLAANRSAAVSWEW